MLELIGLAAAGASAAVGYIQSRRFVRRKLRFVDAAQSPKAPWVAGATATLVAIPVVAILPVVGAGTAILFGASVGVGVARGAKDVRTLNGG